ncbi:1,2-diacylglycerol 3-beta-galactosyltransferase [Fistulifera solaris]|uniref:monogalactosyldiacylglycerol synthase n=1 Tax=Fistulifera solaris TaxID=1519565 RepID=A0A1Z5KCC3_FISSO|nr:1,2-diacylglycerol 3-beta-galactosyltransferase [Fistulifera solaris]|eukprot:GAX23913.1 1,2-diacylglycerol 3-beta-galactosyltransferase [Fistulifera solaris]
MDHRLFKRFSALLWLLVLQTTFAWVSNTAPRHSQQPLSVKKTRVLDDTSATTTITQPKATIQILMSDTGGGHRASANALRDAWNTLYPNQIDCEIVDIYTEYGPVWPYNDYVRMYKLMAQYPWTWDLFFRFGSTPFGLWLNAILLETICFQSFVTCLQQPDFTTTKHRADMVVSVHPLCQDIALKILAYLDRNGATRDPHYRTTPFCTVVTDLGGAHPTWFHPQVDYCFVPSDALRQLALKRNLQPSQIVQHGLPIRQGFWNNAPSSSTSKAPQRTALGLHPDLPTVLLVGGGDGMGGLVEMAVALQQELADAQLVVICGNNRAAQATLQQHSNNNMVVQGFVSNMDEYMRAADVLVTKAGPGTIAEACICGLPCLLFAYLPGQEEGNIPFVEQGGFGAYCSDPKEIATTVRSWIADPQQLAVMQENAFKAARPQATLDIARDLAEIVFRHNEKKVDGGIGKGESRGVVESSL